VSLHPNRLECASGHLNMAEIDDVEVLDEGFVFHGRGCRVSLRFANGTAEMEAWLAALSRVLDGEEAASGASAAPSPVEPCSGSRSSMDAADTPVRQLCRTSSDLAAGPTRCVHEGPLEFEPWRGQRKPRHGVLYGTKLDLFGAAEEADGGHPPCLSLPMGSIQELRVLDMAFELRTSAVTLVRQLRMPTRRDFEEWRQAWGLVLSGDRDIERRVDGRGWFRRSCMGRRRSSTAARPRATAGGHETSRSSTAGRGAAVTGNRWAGGMSVSSSQSSPSKGGLLHQGPLALVRHGRTEACHFMVFVDRLEYYGDATASAAGVGRRGCVRPADIREVRVLEHGFVLGMGRESIELHVASMRDMDTWVKVLRTVLDPAAADEARQQQLKEQPDQQEAEAEDEEELEGLSSYHSQEASILGGHAGSESSAGQAFLGDWLDSQQERPLHRGELGFHDKGRLTRRYCVLFPEHLDCWDLPVQAGSKPSVYIQLSDIRGLEIISSGFVLNSRGRRTGVHVNSNEELQAWTRALLSVLAPSDGSEVSTSATPLASVSSTPSGVGTPGVRLSRPRSGSQGGASGSAVRAPSSGAGPRSSNPGLPGSPRLRSSASSSSKGSGSFVPRVAGLSPSGATRGKSPERERPAVLSVHTVHDPRPAVGLIRPLGRESGGEWASRNVAAKIVEPGPGRSPLLQQREERAVLADKVTGAGSRPQAAAKPKPEISGKITEATDGSRGSAAMTRSRSTAAGEAVAPKVNEAGRVPLVSARNVPSHGIPEKITQARGARRNSAIPAGRS